MIRPRATPHPEIYLKIIKNRWAETSFQFPFSTWKCVTNFYNTMLSHLHEKETEVW
jgi:hypothetical protein